MIGGVLIMMFCGSFFLWASISVYVLSYFHHIDPSKAKLGEKDIYWVDLGLVALNCIGHFVGSYLLKNCNLQPRLLIFIAGAISLSSYFIASFLSSFKLFILFYGCIGALGCGMCYMVPLVTATEWYPNHKGTVSGIIVGAFGAGSAIYTLLAKHIVNPKDEKALVSTGQKELKFFKRTVSDNVPKLLRVLSFIWSL